MGDFADETSGIRQTAPIAAAGLYQRSHELRASSEFTAAIF
jgi:hypothetical protein